MQVLHELRKTFIELLVIGFVITECLTLLEGINVLSSTLPLPSNQEMSSTSKVENVKQESLQHVKQSSVAMNGYEGNKNGRNRKTEKIGRMSRQGPKIWDQWGNWSGCSVTCGAGKISRWRHCISGSCSIGEKAAQLKTCTFPAC